MDVRQGVKIGKLDHSALVVRDLERSGRFYAEVLGLEELERPSNFTFAGRWFRGPGFELHLILEEDTTAPAGFGELGEGERTGLAHHLGFEVEDLYAAVEHLRVHGVEVVGGPLKRGDSPLQVWFYDPDGNFLEFFARADESATPVKERPSVRPRERKDA